MSTPPPDAAPGAATAILDAFARATGLERGAPPRRYLWTDAYAVGAWLGLYGRTREARHLEQARALVTQVHEVLGRHRPDAPHPGWLSGLPDERAGRHPTIGGLRIGKPLAERASGQPHDPTLEWDRDGQYFHYLTRWMHALDRMAVVTADPEPHRWAVELAVTAHARFTQGAPGARRMVWKMSVDLTRPLVSSMGHHDPLDGLVGAAALQDSPARGAHAPDLEAVVTDFAGICAGRTWATDDPLGLGGLLVDALRVGRMVAHGRRPWRALLRQLVTDGADSLDGLQERSPFGAPPARRLAFRELGLALGLRAAERLAAVVAPVPDPALHRQVARLAPHVPLAGDLERTWSDPAAQDTYGWREHADINAVSLAACLVPEGWLDG